MLRILSLGNFLPHLPSAPFLKPPGGGSSAPRPLVQGICAFVSLGFVRCPVTPGVLPRSPVAPAPPPSPRLVPPPLTPRSAPPSPDGPVTERQVRSASVSLPSTCKHVFSSIHPSRLPLLLLREQWPWTLPRHMTPPCRLSVGFCRGNGNLQSDATVTTFISLSGFWAWPGWAPGCGSAQVCATGLAGVPG